MKQRFSVEDSRLRDLIKVLRAGFLDILLRQIAELTCFEQGETAGHLLICSLVILSHSL